MKIDKENYNYRLELARELDLLKGLLLKTKIQIKSVEAIALAVRRLKDESFLPKVKTGKNDEEKASPLSWGYSINGFILEIDISNNLQYPKRIKKAFLDFSVNLNGVYFDPSVEIRDPFSHLEFNIVIEGKTNREKEHILSYHLDRHIEGGNNSKEVHPIYHFQIGGKKMDDYRIKNRNFGNQLIADSPRFMHYPMDFISGIDFILSNFAPDIWRKLQREPGYLKIVKNAHGRTIKPFVASLANHFNLDSIPNSWDSKKICPQLI